ncbi:MAG: NUDIX hydrolase [Actinomycetota bacterium]
MTDPTDPADVPIRPAATVMTVRDAADGIEVFILQRTVAAAFAGGMYVYPGGKVDDADGAAAIEPFCDGLTDAVASERLGIERGGLSYWVAAVRECFEESGILLARTRAGGVLDVRDEERHAVHEGDLAMVDLCRRHELVLDLSTTEYAAHWITPIGERRRFDTRFFVTEVPSDQAGSHDDKETTASRWVRPVDALAMVESEELMMLPPTISTMRFLAEHATAAEAVAAAAALGEIPAILPKLRHDADGSVIGVAMPGDADYDTL